MKHKSAFTLIELLVVISIIATLAALLVPTLLKIMERGRAADDLNNLRGLGQGLAQYRVDQKDSIFSLAAAGEDAWPQQLQRKYIRDWRSFRSPFDTVNTARPKGEANPVPVSYGLNAKLFDTFAGKWKAPVSTLIAIAPAVDPKAIGKEVRFLQNAFSNHNVSVEPTGAGVELGTYGSREMINVLFAGGNAEVMTWRKFSDNVSERGKQQWDPMD